MARKINPTTIRIMTCSNGVAVRDGYDNCGQDGSSDKVFNKMDDLLEFIEEMYDSTMMYPKV